MFVSSILSALSALSVVRALPKNAHSSGYAVKERHDVPRGWTRVGDASKGDMIRLSIGLKQQNEGVVEQHLLEVSDPAHFRYGQHLTAAEIQDIVKPADETRELVQAWLEEHGIANGVHSPARDFIHVTIPIEQAERLLQTSYSTFKHGDGSTIHRAPEWSLPLHLHEHIDVVQPTTSFFKPTPNWFPGSRPHLTGPSRSPEWVQHHYGPHKPHGGSGHGGIGAGDGAGPISQICNASFVTPDCIRTLYGTYDYEPQVPDKNSVAHTNYLNETSYRADIHKFLETFRPEAAEAAYQFESIIVDNGVDDQGPYTAAELKAGTNIEAILDSTQILSISWPTKFNTWNTGGMPPFIPDINTPTDTNEPYLTWLDYVLGQSELPNVISTSYGDDEQTVPESYAKRACSGFAQLGARGISVLFSSGDAGVGSDGTCYSNDGKHTYKFLPAFPAGCPWVTAVGGTANFTPEVAVSRFASGAGFSNYFPAPEYGVKTWDAYIASLNGLHDGLYNKAGRAYPDVAAQGNHDAIVYAGNISTVGGTSASSPTFAGVIALVNDALIAEGKPSLGFLNPWIYGGAYKALTDVVSGSSYGCNTTGFPAQAGWDAVTGFGTPNFGKLVEAAFQKDGEGWSWGKKHGWRV